MLLRFGSRIEEMVFTSLGLNLWIFSLSENVIMLEMLDSSGRLLLAEDDFMWCIRSGSGFRDIYTTLNVGKHLPPMHIQVVFAK